MIVNNRRIIMEAAVLRGDYDSEYAQFIMDNCGGDRMICNGDTLILAQENGYLFDEFVDYLEDLE